MAEFTIRVVESQPVMSVRAPTTLAELGTAIADQLNEVAQYLDEVGVRVVGKPFTRYHHVTEEVIDLEAGLPVAETFRGSGRVTGGLLPGGEVAVATHEGPYEGLVATSLALAGWIEAQGRRPAGPQWEIYAIDAGDDPDPGSWRTDIVRPLA